MGRHEPDVRMAVRDLTYSRGRTDAFRRAAQPSLPLMFLRSNGALFYSLATALLLETRAPAAAERAAAVFVDDRDFRDWLRTDWAPRRVARAHRLREYLVEPWPEFDPAVPEERFSRAMETHAVLQPGTGAHEALRRCVAVSQSALFYRCLARWAEDVRLRAMADAMARDDVAAFARFRAKYESSPRRQRFKVWQLWRSAHDEVRGARDHYVRAAFTVLVAEWGPNAPFGPMSYSEFLKRIRAVIDRYGALGWTERFVLRAWRGAVSKMPDQTAPKVAPGFKSVIPADGEREQSYYSWGVPVGRRS